jgi:hypothetical protein
MKFRLRRIKKISFLDTVNCQNHVNRIHKFGSHLQENTQHRSVIKAFNEVIFLGLFSGAAEVSWKWHCATA